MTNTHSFTFGTRGSALARRQTDTVADRLRDAFPQAAIAVTVFSTRGDRELDKPLPQIGGKGLFTAELEAALRDGRIDLAVHSLKDLPTEDAPGLTIGAVLPREDPADVLVSRSGYTLETLPAGATVGTSSLRRAAQLLAHRPDLRILPLRGNVDTRLKKALDPAGPYNAIILAAAGLNRMRISDHGGQQIPFAVMLPAPGQGAVAVQCRAGDEPTLRCLARLDHLPTRQAVTAERAFLAGLGGGCSVPVGALGAVNGETLILHGVVASVDGTQVVRLREQGSPHEAEATGRRLAQRALAQGAAAILTLTIND
ncbi:MAG: hydroxymethylbilane synthase [Anaerolineae bacterium]